MVNWADEINEVNLGLVNECKIVLVDKYPHEKGGCKHDRRNEDDS